MEMYLSLKGGKETRKRKRARNHILSSWEEVTSPRNAVAGDIIVLSTLPTQVI
jgi:hypothetical protein